MTWGKDKAPRARGTFEEEWPDLARGLDRTLRARHVPSARREDIIQETALRLFVRWLELDPDRPLWPFAITIAMNLLKDEQRMQARRNASPQPPELVGRGVEEEALARLELTNVQIALQKLTPAQRSVLLAEVGAAPYDDRGADALKMLRMRARRTLRNVIGRASLLFPFPIPRVRRLVNSLGVASQRATGLDAGQGLALSTLGVAGAATILGASLGIGFAPGAAGSIPGGVAALAGSASTGATEGAIARVRPYGESAQRLASEARVSQGRSGGSHALGRSGHAPAPSAAHVDARGTGIDEDPSLESESYRLSIVARAAAAGQGAVIEQEVEQGNPACGSPADPRDRPCVRPTKPRVRSEVQLAGQGAAVGSPR